jgi:hypothetical protein
MKKISLGLSLGSIFCSLAYLTIISFASRADAATGTANLDLTVQEYLTFSVSSGSAVSFGNLTPGTPISAPNGGTVCSVTTNASNGYTIGVHDSVAGSDSALVNADTTTRIADYAGTIGTPTSWSGTGLGITLYEASTSKEAKWGTGTTYNDANNKYSGIPQVTTIFHTVTGFHSGADTSAWSFKVDVPNSQKTGAYTGTVTFTALAVLS